MPELALRSRDQLHSAVIWSIMRDTNSGKEEGRKAESVLCAVPRTEHWIRGWCAALTGTDSTRREARMNREERLARNLANAEK
jgi:hypothetical protein